MVTAGRVLGRLAGSQYEQNEVRRANLWESLRRHVTGNLLFPASNYLLNRRHILGTYRRSRQAQWYAQEQLREIQLVKLRQLLHYAQTSVPFYRQRFAQLGLRAEDIHSLEDLRHIPPLSRGDVIEHGKEMVDECWASSVAAAEQRPPSSLGAPISFARFKKHKLVKCSSSGSSGEPVVYYEHGSKSAVSWAFELLLKSWHDIDPGMTESRFVRLSKDYLPNSATARLRRMMWRQWILPGLSLSAREYDACLSAMLKFRPHVLWGFVSAMTGLAEYIRENRISLRSYRPDLIVGWAEPTYDHQQQLLTDVFQCRVTSLYSCHEVGHIAAQCPAGRFRVNQEHLLVETEPALLQEPASQLGEVLVTSLYETPMPFIRYRLGDVAELGTHSCPCGRNLQTLSNLAGRSSEIFTTKRGRMVAPNFWCHLLRREPQGSFIRQFQVVYRKDGGIRLNLIAHNGLPEATESHLRNLIAQGLEGETNVEFAYVAEIPRLSSGKAQLVVREA